jgi:hypothetical protein
MCLVSVSGMLVYMLEMSKDAKVCDGLIGVCFCFCISCVEFLTLRANGRGASSFIFCVSDLDSVYTGAFLQFTSGRTGRSLLCSFMSPFMVGAEGFRLYLQAEFVG